MSENPNKDLKKKNNSLNKFVRYSSLVFEMGIMITGAAFGGRWIDTKMQNETPWFTVFLSLIAVVGSTYLLIKRITDDK